MCIRDASDNFLGDARVGVDSGGEVIGGARYRGRNSAASHGVRLLPRGRTHDQEDYMSMYGPPGGPYPGQPQDPWQGGQPQDPYGPPPDPYSQPWGQQDPYGGGGPPQSGPPGGYGPQTGSYPGGYGQQSPGYGYPPQQQQGYGPGYGGGYGPGEQWGPPTPPPKKGGSGVLVTVVVVLAVLLCAGGATGLWYVTRDNSNTANPSNTTPPTGDPSANPSGSASSSANPSPSVGNDAVTAAVNECFVNQGTEDKPSLKRQKCAAGTYQVLKRIEDTTDTTQCEGTKDYTHHYYYQQGPKKFVLCMKII
jgi:hypothetical protein